MFLRVRATVDNFRVLRDTGDSTQVSDQTCSTQFSRSLLFLVALVPSQCDLRLIS